MNIKENPATSHNCLYLTERIIHFWEERANVLKSVWAMGDDVRITMHAIVPKQLFCWSWAAGCRMNTLWSKVQDKYRNSSISRKMLEEDDEASFV